ncbi:ATP-binding protein [Caldifermentibacillus hisashii]|uniref:ATP-binding protein n=1 Tax=Caldifermentibacillus hisashii TaxID=996558 RepID=UPI00313555C4
MQKISITKLNKQKMFGYCDLIEEYIDRGETSFLLNFTSTSFFEPFAMVYFLAFVHRCKNILNIKFEVERSILTEACSYAEFMGFFEALEGVISKNYNLEYNGRTYIKIHSLTKKKIREYEFENGIDMADSVTYFSSQMAKFLLRNKNSNKNTQEILTYALREIIRNSLEHSTSSDIWCAGQYWERSNSVEVVILDNGVGIKNTITKNIHVRDRITNDLDAIKYAMLPGLSGVAFERNGTKPPDYGYPENSGYGLYVTSEICSNYGEFLIASGDSYLRKTPDVKREREIHHEGTAISLKLNLDTINTVSIEDIVKKGEEIALKYPFKANKNASVLSKKL